MIRELFHRLIDAPPMPRRIAWAAWEKLWQNGVAWGATLSSLGWIALILFALAVAELVRRGR